MMKTRLNLTIEEGLLTAMKAYALRKQKSVSELVELYFEAVTRPAKRRTVIDLVEDLKKPELESSIDLKELFYKEQAKKYGL